MAENFDIVVSESGAREVQRNIEGIGTAAKKVEGSLGSLQRVLGAYLSLQGLKNLGKMADSFTEMSNRIAVLDSRTSSTAATFKRLYDISQDTRSSLKDNVLLYQRMGLAQKGLNATGEELYKMTEAVGKAIAIQGGLATTSAGAVLQLSQAFGSGRVQLEEFNSVITGIYPIAQAAANGIKAAGGSIAELRNLIKNGKISSQDLFQGILAGLGLLDDQFNKTVPTVQQAFTILDNLLVYYVGQLNASINASGTFANAIIGVAHNADTAAKAFAVFAAALAPAVLSVMISQVLKLAAAVRALAMSNPITGLATIFVALLGYLLLFNEGLDDTARKLNPMGTAIDRLGATWVGVLAYIKAAWADFPRWFKEIIDSAVIAALKRISTFGTTLANLFNVEKGGAAESLLNKFNFTIPKDILERQETNGQDAAKAFSDAYSAYLVEANARNAKLLSGGNEDERPGGYIDPLNKSKKGKRDNLYEDLKGLVSQVNPIAGAWLEWNKAQETLNKSLDAGYLSLEDYNDLMGQTYRHFEASLSPLGDFNKELDRQAQLLQLNTQAREIQTQVFSIEDQIGRKLVDTERAQVEAKMAHVQQLSAQREILDELEEPQIKYSNQLDAINTLLADGLITHDAYVKKLHDLQEALLATDTSFQGGFRRGMLEISKSFTDFGSLVERTMTESFSRAEDTFVSFVSTGKASFSDLVNSMLEDLVRLAVRASITGPLANVLGGLASSMFPSTGGSVSMVGSIGSGLAGYRANGGPTDPNSLYRVNERGIPEVWSDGSNDYLMTGSQKGQVHALSPVSRSNAGGVVVQPQVTIINNAEGTKVSARQKQGKDGQPGLEVLIDQVASSLASGISSGQSPLVPAIGSKFGLTPQARGR